MGLFTFLVVFLVVIILIIVLFLVIIISVCLQGLLRHLWLWFLRSCCDLMRAVRVQIGLLFFDGSHVERSGPLIEPVALI